MTIDLINNVCLLLALSMLYSFVVRTWPQNGLQRRVAAGCLFGTVAMLGMMMPFHFAPGIFFDGRTIVISMAGLFGGPVAVTIASLPAIAYRYWLGGSGTVMGVGTIATAAVMGVGFHYVRRARPEYFGSAFLLGFGVLVHLAMLMWIEALPGPLKGIVMQSISLPVILIFPLGTLLLGRLLDDQESRISALNALQKSENRFVQFMRRLPGYAYIKDQQGRYIYVNDHIEQCSGIPASEVIGQTSEHIWPARTAKTLRTYDQAVLQDHKPVTFVEELPLRDENKFYLNYKFSFSEQDGRLFVGGISMDITDRVKAEQRLQENERRLKLIAESANVGLWDWNLQTNEVYFSSEWKRQLGYGDSEIADCYESVDVGPGGSAV